jgi:hypothetical protein
MEYKLDLRDNVHMSKNMGGGGFHGISNKIFVTVHVCTNIKNFRNKKNEKNRKK